MASSRVGASTSADGAVPRPGGEAAEQRQREGRRLPGTGGGLAEQVASLEQRRDRLGLDRRRLLVAQRDQPLEQFRT